MSTLYCAVHESEIGPSRTFLLSQRTSAFRGKPDTKVLIFSTRYSAAQFANTKNHYCCSAATLDANELATATVAKKRSGLRARARSWRHGGDID